MAAVLFGLLAATLHVPGILSIQYSKDPDLAGRFWLQQRPARTWDFGTFRNLHLDSGPTFPNTDYQLFQSNWLNKKDSAIKYKWQKPVEDNVIPRYSRTRLIPKGAGFPYGGFRPSILNKRNGGTDPPFHYVKGDPKINHPAIDVLRSTERDIHEFPAFGAEYLEVNEETSSTTVDNSATREETLPPNNQNISTSETRGQDESGSSITDSTNNPVDDSTRGTHGSTNLGDLEITNQVPSIVQEDNQDNKHLEVETSRPTPDEHETSKATADQEEKDVDGKSKSALEVEETTKITTEQEENTGAEDGTIKPSLEDEETTETTTEQGENTGAENGKSKPTLENEETTEITTEKKENTGAENGKSKPTLENEKTTGITIEKEENTGAENGKSKPTLENEKTTEITTEQEENTGAESRKSKPTLGDAETTESATEQEEIQGKTGFDDKPDSSSATRESLSPDNRSSSTWEVSSVVTKETDDSSASILDETTLSVRDNTGDATLSSHSDIRPSSSEPPIPSTSLPSSTATSATSESGAVTERDISISSIKAARMAITVVFLVIGLIAIAVLAVYMFKEKRRRVKYDQLTLLP